MEKARVTSAALLARRLRRNRAVKEDSRPQPVVVLLGPVGSGKSFALDLMEADCGAAVVHAKIGFQRDHPTNTTEVLAQIARDLSKDWPARGSAKFTRFVLCLIAVYAKLDRVSPESDKKDLQGMMIAAEQGRDIADGFPGGVKTTLPTLMRTVRRRSLDKSRKWHLDIPDLEGTAPLDALLWLNEQVTEDPGSLGSWLTAAFLADVRENHPRMARPDPGSPCVCGGEDRRRHWHNWVLLLDDIDHGAGGQFLKDLSIARDRGLRRDSKAYDPLLVIATSGQWNHDWGVEWRPVWIPEPNSPDRVRTVVRCREASYRHWYGGQDPDTAPAWHYPVLLEPLDISETARILDVKESSRKCALIHRATRGLPAAVMRLDPLLQGDLGAGNRNALFPPDDSAVQEEDRWLDRLSELELTRHLPDVDLRKFVTAAPYEIVPWLMSTEEKGVLPRPEVGRILTELRTALWVVAPGERRGVVDHTELHPWVSRTLALALAARPRESARGYTEQFEEFLEDAKIVNDQTRKLYCQMALGWFTNVVEFFRDTFDQEPHGNWSEQLELVTTAPDNLPSDQDRASLFQGLIDQWVRSQPDSQSVVGNVVARLVAAMWLGANPFSVEDRDQQLVIQNSFRELVVLSRRPDVSALYVAARRAAEDRL